MIRLIAIIAGGIVLFLLYRWLKARYAKEGRPFAIKATLVAVATILIILAATGRVHWLGAMAASLLAVLRFALPMLFKALPVLQFLQRNRTQNQSSNTVSNSKGTMTEAEAYKILGLTPSASKEEIITAHRQLIQKLHPDRGGNEFLATQLNLAKEILLKDEHNR